MDNQHDILETDVMKAIERVRTMCGDDTANLLMAVIDSQRITIDNITRCSIAYAGQSRQ